MAQTGLDAYRFSISWSRVIPTLLPLSKNGIQPHVTLLHWDLPLALQDAYGGWDNQQFVRDFTAYADVCFSEFGDRVLNWATINEPNLLALLFSNDRLSAAHHLLLGHASVVNLYRDKYQAKQNGNVGLNVFTAWLIPQGDTKEDLIVTERAAQFFMGWFIHPVVFGDYPKIMKHTLGSRLPSFTKHQTKILNGSYDFIGLNMYNAAVVTKDPSKDGTAFNFDFRAVFEIKNVGAKFVQGVLEYIKRVYGNPPTYIHETGLRTLRNASFHDTKRVGYLNASLGSLLDAIRNGTDVRGFIQWSFLDLFETSGGYKYGFGLYNVDLNDPNLRRYPKLSAKWYSKFLKGERPNYNGVIKQMNNSTFIL